MNNLAPFITNCLSELLVLIILRHDKTQNLADRIPLFVRKIDWKYESISTTGKTPPLVWSLHEWFTMHTLDHTPIILHCQTHQWLIYHSALGFPWMNTWCFSILFIRCLPIWPHEKNQDQSLIIFMLTPWWKRLNTLLPKFTFVQVLDPLVRVSESITY